jgi:hypothetical protein
MIDSKQKDEIIKMWEQGLSGTQIGEKLNMTRNTVIGIVSRLRRKGHVFARDEKEQHKKRVIEARKVREKDYAKRHAKKPIIIIPKDLPVVAAPALPTTSGGIDLLELKRLSCRYPISPDEAPEMIFCGKPQEHGSYCKEHGAICYYPAKQQSTKLPE